MKTTILMATAAAALISTASCKSKAQKDAEDYMSKIEKTVKENSPPNSGEQTAKKDLVPLPADMKNIVGEWELVRVFGDKNGNHKIEAEEEKDAFTTLKDYMKLNANGTCEYTIVKLEGQYEIITQDEGDKKLVMYDRTGNKVMSGRYILSVTDKELVINRIMGGSDFEVFERR